MRAVLAVRSSTDDKNQDPMNQLLPLRAAMARLGITVVAEVVVEGLSAWNPKTAAEVKRRFLAPIVAGQADLLAVWGLDRVVRGGIEATLAFIRELEQHWGGKLYSLQEPWASSATQDPKTRELIVSLIAWVAEQESGRRSERVRAKVHAKRNRAGALGQSAKWGLGVLATPEQQAAVLQYEPAVPVRRIAAEVGLSKSQVHRIRQSGCPEGTVGTSGAVSGSTPPSNGPRLGQETSRRAPAGPALQRETTS